MSRFIAPAPIGFSIASISGAPKPTTARPPVRADFNGGRHRIKATVAKASTPNIPVGERVYLFDKSFTPIRIVQSDKTTGEYIFNHIRAGHLVLALDHTGQYRPVAADNLVLEPMPLP